MRKVIWCILAAFFMVSFTSGGLAYPHEPAGYLGYPWGTSFDNIPGLVKDTDNQVFAGARRPQDLHVLYIGEQTVPTGSEVVWLFSDWQFGAVIGTVERETGIRALNMAMETYGQPTKSYRDENALYYVWNGQVTRVLIYVPDDQTKPVNIGFSSVEYMINKLNLK